MNAKVFPGVGELLLWGNPFGAVLVSCVWRWCGKGMAWPVADKGGEKIVK